MLKVIDIKKSFYGKEILKKVSFDAFVGQLTVLEGQNGAGKSTLFNIIACLLDADAGEIRLDDLELTELSTIAASSYIAILKQDPKASSCPSLSVLDNLLLASLKDKTASLARAMTESNQEKIKKHLANLELDFISNLERPMGMLSGGQRQILAFAMATAIKPSLLLLDEPTAALDDKSSHLLMKLIKRMLAQWSIPAVMISHDHDINRLYGDKIIKLEDGLCLTL